MALSDHPADSDAVADAAPRPHHCLAPAYSAADEADCHSLQPAAGVILPAPGPRAQVALAMMLEAGHAVRHCLWMLVARSEMETMSALDLGLVSVVLQVAVSVPADPPAADW